jgi:hypothetical protein
VGLFFSPVTTRGEHCKNVFKLEVNHGEHCNNVLTLKGNHGEHYNNVVTLEGNHGEHCNNILKLEENHDDQTAIHLQWRELALPQAAFSISFPLPTEKSSNERNELYNVRAETLPFVGRRRLGLAD